jgi:hypothetical protein
MVFTETERRIEMATQTTPRNQNAWIGGAALIAIGLLALVGQFVKSDALGLLFLPALGIIFIAWGIGRHSFGLLIPGGILSGIGMGVFLSVSLGTLSAETRGAIVLLSMAAGFAIITPFSMFFSWRTQWWSLIVAGFMALVGGALLIGGAALDALQLAGYLWPLILIALGAYFIFRRTSAQGICC